MAYLPLDLTRWGDTSVLAEPSPDLDPDGIQKRTREGVPRWRVLVAVVPPGQASRAEVISLVVPAAEAPWITPMSRVVLVDPVAITWEISGRSGISYQAADIHELDPAPAAGVIA